MSSGDGESSEALDMWKQLERTSPHDPALDRADLEIRKRKLFKKMAETK